MQAVHSGADLESAISNCMGYKSEVTREIMFPRACLFSSISRFSCNWFALNCSSGSGLHGWGTDKSSAEFACWFSSNVY